MSTLRDKIAKMDLEPSYHKERKHSTTIGYDLLVPVSETGRMYQGDAAIFGVVASREDLGITIQLSSAEGIESPTYVYSIEAAQEFADSLREIINESLAQKDTYLAQVSDFFGPETGAELYNDLVEELITEDLEEEE